MSIHKKMFDEDPDCMTPFIRTPSTMKDGVEGLPDIMNQLRIRPTEAPTQLSDANEMDEEDD